jgi:hypothetical protein
MVALPVGAGQRHLTGFAVILERQQHGSGVRLLSAVLKMRGEIVAPGDALGVGN